MRSRRVSTDCRRCVPKAAADGARFRLADDRGQSSVEYTLVVFALLAVIVACSLLWRTLDEGLFVSHAAAGASHHIGRGSPGAVADVLLY